MPKYKKNKDGYYRATFVVGKTDNGKPKRVTVRAKNKGELENLLSEAKRLHGHGTSLGETTVLEWSKRWLAVYKANSSDSQQSHYNAKLNNDILPVIGCMRVCDVRASHLQELLNSYAGGKTSTVKKIKITINQLFDAAEIEGLIEKNPARRLMLPADLKETERRPLTFTERVAVYEAAKTHKRGAYALTMILCGVRLGECAALLAGDVDFDRSRIKITKSLKFKINQGAVKNPKSEAGFREVPIPDNLRPYLQKACGGKSPKDFLFPKKDGGRATKQSCKRWWQSFIRQCHIVLGAKTYRNKVLIETSPFDDNITPHYLRHTYSTDLYAAGVDDKAQHYFLGHALNDITDRYRKMSEEAFLRAQTQINNYHETNCVSPLSEQLTPEQLQYCVNCKKRI